ncbi:hypothetical protein AURDEDRAFT_131879, partial [Auricularia subglabra TFB-10046 SS5]
MSSFSHFLRPQAMTDPLFKACVEWATCMDQAVNNELPVPLDEVPLLYDTFRRTNPDTIDPVFARALQRHQRERRLVQHLRESNIPIPPPPPAVAMVPLPAIELMLANTKAMLGTVQRDARWQLQSALRAVGRSVPPPPAPPMRGFRNRNWNRRDQQDHRALPELDDFLLSFINEFTPDYAPRPRNSMRRPGFGHNGPTGPRLRDRLLRRAGRPRTIATASTSARTRRTRPLRTPFASRRLILTLGFSSASPYNDAPTQPEAQAPMAPIFDLRTPEPPIAISDDGSHGTATPRAASPAPSVH